MFFSLLASITTRPTTQTFDWTQVLQSSDVENQLFDVVHCCGISTLKKVERANLALFLVIRAKKMIEGEARSIFLGIIVAKVQMAHFPHCSSSNGQSVRRLGIDDLQALYTYCCLTFEKIAFFLTELKFNKKGVKKPSRKLAKISGKLLKQQQKTYSILSELLQVLWQDFEGGGCSSPDQKGLHFQWSTRYLLYSIIIVEGKRLFEMIAINLLYQCKMG